MTGLGRLLAFEIGPWEVFALVLGVTGLMAFFAARASHDLGRKKMVWPLGAVGGAFILSGFAAFDMQFPPLTVGYAVLHLALCVMFFQLAHTKRSERELTGSLRSNPVAAKANPVWDMLEKKMGVQMPTEYKEQLERLDKLLPDRLLAQKLKH